jgi:hypothetical protein
LTDGEERKEKGLLFLRRARASRNEVKRERERETKIAAGE